MNLFTAERNNCRRRFIMLVKNQPILWNKTREDYKRNRPQKLQTWQAIADEMDTTVDKARRTWDNLRDQYRRDMKREMKYGYISKWRFFYDMDFIRDMVTCKGPQNEFNDSDSELESTELSHFLPETLDPNAQFNEPRVVANHESNHTVTTSNISEFHPVILSKQWQKAPDNKVSPQLDTLPETVQVKKANTNPGSEECLPACDISKSDYRLPEIRLTPPTTSSTNLSDSSRNMNLEPPNIPVDLEIPTKSEPESDIEMGPTRRLPMPPIFPINTTIHLDSPNAYDNFQESHVSTSTHKRACDVQEESLAVRASTPVKKRKSSDSDLHSKDEDYYFVMSLLPSLRQIPRNKKFPLRIGLMNLIAQDLEEV